MSEFLMTDELKGEVKFILLKPRDKDPIKDVPWSDPRNQYDYGHPTLMGHIQNGGNYGVVPGPNVVIIDCDTPELLEYIRENCPKLYNTYMVEGQLGHRHIYILCEDYPGNKIFLKSGNKELGDIRQRGFYVVGPGSIHPITQAPYKPHIGEVATLTYRELVDFFDPFIPKVQFRTPVAERQNGTPTTLSEELNLRITDVMNVPNRRENFKGDVLMDNPMEPSSQGNLNFSVNIHTNLWKCFHHNVGGDPAAWILFAELGYPEGTKPRKEDGTMDALKQWLREHGHAMALRAARNRWKNGLVDEDGFTPV